jgi:hypothetical protein
MISISRIESAHNLFSNSVSIFRCHSQIFMLLLHMETRMHIILSACNHFTASLIEFPVDIYASLHFGSSPPVRV